MAQTDQLGVAVANGPNGNGCLAFEKPLADLESQIAELRNLQTTKGIDYSPEIRQLRANLIKLTGKIYDNLSAWETIQVSRHPRRPILADYLELMVKDFRELHGDRCFGDDRAMVTGFGRIGREKVMLIGHNKGRDTRERINCNFGCARPEGYRKALQKMKLAEKFNLPVVCLIDTPGADPGIGAEERGQAQAIAFNMMEMSRLRVPVVCVVIGEGGSGGALGIGVGDRVAMLQYSYYSVISPEGCAAILWKNGTEAPAAADALKLTSKDILKLGAIDAIVPEPLGGAHRNRHEAAHNLENYIIKSLRDLRRCKTENLLDNRYKKIRAIGQIQSAEKPAVTSQNKAKQVSKTSKAIHAINSAAEKTPARSQRTSAKVSN
ncbi:MAG: acetyl-CoA carboxylase carboxyltransferase subunit alpha [Sedimentisphaerales bacterium]|nr:acetyl-CoA carboxylase carboxyltransferase subunit alpha [Sedimentisphaerales bacterium]